ncbi:MAG: peptidoglycan DD-metalloendopeptidase family protein [Defluviitaleaceae bacterium]|nr:peptidoglycan DD-metalloendopeptidase family protein [Defluviitaleaceae bacterium]
MKKKKYLLPKIAVGAMATFMLFVAVDGVAIARSLTDLNRQRQEVRDEISGLRDLLNEAQAERRDTEAEILMLDIELMEAGNELFLVQESLAYTEERLADAEAALVQAEIDREERFDVLRGRLRFMHQNGNLSYIDLLLGSQNLTDFLNNREHFRRIVEHDNAMVTELIELEEQIAATRDEIAEQVVVLEIQTQNLEDAMASLEATLLEREIRLMELGYNESHAASMLASAEATEREVQSHIVAAEAEANRIRAEQRALQTRTGNVRVQSDAQMAWPVGRAAGVNSDYGWRQRPIGRGTEFHEGIDMTAPFNTPILASEDGVVTFSGWMGGYGNTIIVDHGGGISTLYAHNTANMVSVGQWVYRGQQIARAGSTGHSTGSHLHFEVRINGRHTDPAPFVGWQR